MTSGPRVLCGRRRRRRPVSARRRHGAVLPLHVVAACVGWRPLLVLYPLVMQVSLTYTGEHYVVDGIAGGLCAYLVHLAASRAERQWAARRVSEEHALGVT